ncbi:uncharacterized protein BP5553_04642 [Venustampulla echinocandica]|uniref:Heterokaryon incompatibility domain-containing protein n=1 Tax=Venustampulla echinocandica TaxID=2656787 RepID=A0A370TNW2_9HELO|nr:uncharacterized protein BP5553_04642 [Venustampulla echinocandica]RDL37209.1 hypothetical protein BP5553_04642 [Venustampulla echinocandica]
MSSDPTSEGDSSSGVLPSEQRPDRPDQPVVTEVQEPTIDESAHTDAENNDKENDIEDETPAKPLAPNKPTPKTHPGWSRDPAKLYALYTQTLSDEELSVFKEKAVYCPCCFTISRDLSIFSSKLPLKPNQTPIIRWSLDLLALVEATEARCTFCTFMAVKFFFRSGLLVFGVLELNNDIACCAAGDLSQVTEATEKAISKLREFCGKNPGAGLGMVVEPIDYVPEERRVSRIKISAQSREVISQKAASELLRHSTSIILEICTTKDDPAAQFIKGRPINPDPASEASINQAKTWINDCLHNHSECPSPTPTPLPKRILKISPDAENLSLYTSSQDNPAPYTALSYCWGESQSFTTTLATFSHVTAGFQTSELPQTLQDAVILTAKLGLEYIWIDSLCIIQDSPEDKADEIPKMAAYYKNAHATICAAGGSASDGFLHTRHECEKHPGLGLSKNLLSMPYFFPVDDEDPNSKEAVVGTMYFCEDTPHLLSWEPVSRRSWTLQEQLLSPRVLMYGSRLVWQCHSKQAADGGVEDWSGDRNASDHRRIQLALRDVDTESSDATLIVTSTSSEKDPNGPASEDIDKNPPTQGAAPTKDKDITSLLQIWYHSLRMFSRRALTYAPDKLPAIAGLATEFANLSGDTYLAGHWRSQLLRELMWSTYPNLKLFKPSQWRAPTWSWASVDNDLYWEWMPDLRDVRMRGVAEVLDVGTGLKYEGEDNVYGEVEEEGCRLVIRGPVLSMDGGKGGEDGLSSYLRGVYGMPPPSGVGTDWLQESMGLLPQDGGKVGGDSEWVAPVGAKLLVLWARVGRDGDEEDVEKDAESNAKPESEDKKVVTDDERKEMVKNKLDSSNRAVLSGIVIGKTDDGKYEKVATFTKFSLTVEGGPALGFLEGSAEVVDIV